MSKLIVDRIGAGLLLVATGWLLGHPWPQGPATQETASPSDVAAVHSRWRLIPAEQAPDRDCAQGGVRIDRPRSGSSSAGQPPPRLHGGQPASEQAVDAADPVQTPAPGIESTGHSAPERSAPASTVRRPPVVEADEELASAQREFDAAFSHYTTLVTTGGEGDVEQARERYRQSYERLKALKRERGIE